MKKSLLYLFILTNIIFEYNFIYTQENNGLLKKEEIITYWNKEKKQIRSIGKYKTFGAARIGSKIGTWKHYYPNGNVQEIGEYYDGQLNGEFISYYANGKTKIKGNFTLGAADSTFEAYYYNGNLAEKGSYIINPLIKVSDSSQLIKNIEKSDKIISIKKENWFYYYNNGKIMEETYFKPSDTNEYILNYYDTSGKKIVTNGKGSIKNYYPSGKLKVLQDINQGIKNGNYYFYKPNGKIRKSGHYYNGKMDSIWEEKFITSDQLYQIRSYSKGEKNGVFKEFTLSGDLLIDGNYISGNKNGDWTYYYRNKNIDMQGGFKEDQQHGYWKFYYPKGDIYYEGEFINGQKDGEWKFYYNDGNLWRKGIYSHDQKNGLWTTLYENSEKSMEGHFKNNLEDGLWKSWYENGQMKDEGIFNEGEMDNHWKGYYMNGQLKYEGDYQNNYKINKWTYWSSNGKIIEERNYKLSDKRSILIPDENRIIKKSVNHGKWVKYSEYDASVKSIENYDNGKLNGLSTYFHPGGVITSSIISYKDGLLNGYYKSYNRKGNLLSETNYKDNKKHGDMKVYNRRGKIVLHVIYKEGVKTKDILKKITFKYSGPKKEKNK